MPDGDVFAKEDISNNCGVGGHEDESWVPDAEIIEVHDVAVPADSLAVFLGGFQSLSAEKSRQPSAKHVCQ